MVRKTKHPGVVALCGGRFQVFARVRRGRRIVAKQVTIIGTIESARARFELLKQEIRDSAPGGSLTSRIQTFGEALAFYLERHEPGKSKTLFDRLARDLGAVRIIDLAECFDKWFQLMRRSKAQRTGRPISNGTLNRFLAWSNAALNLCQRHGAIEKNPLRHIGKLREIPRDVVLSEIDRQRLLNVVDRESPHLSAVIRFSLQVPCRRGELVRMRRDDLDLFNNAIRVRCGTMKNKDMAAYKPIPPDMLDYFRTIPADCPHLFYRQGRDGAYLPLGDWKRAFKRCLKLAGIEGFRFHDTRHMAASAMLNAGTPEAVVVEIAGWTSSAMLRTYYHRAGVQSLKTVRFSPECEGVCEGVKAAAR